MKHVKTYSIFESESKTTGDISHKAYLALLNISGLPGIFKEQMLLGRDNCAFAIMNDLDYTTQFKASIGSSSPLSKADYDEAVSMYKDEVTNYVNRFDSGWGAENPLLYLNQDPNMPFATTSYMKTIYPYQKLLSLLAALEGSAIKAGRTRIELTDFLSREADYSLSHQPIETELRSGDLGKTLEKAVLALGFDRGDLPGFRGEWTKIK